MTIQPAATCRSEARMILKSEELRKNPIWRLQGPTLQKAQARPRTLGGPVSLLMIAAIDARKSTDQAGVGDKSERHARGHYASMEAR